MNFNNATMMMQKQQEREVAISAVKVQTEAAIATVITSLLSTENELAEVKASLALAVEALKQQTEAVSTTQSKVIETTNMERNVTTNMTTGITSENIIKNDKYISDIGSTLIPFSQLSNKQFNQYLRAIGR